MLVKDYMTKHPLMVQPTMPVIEAQRFMGENNIRHLPIVGTGKRLLGLATRQTLLVQPATLGSLNVWEITRFLSNLTIGDVMVKAEDVITMEKDATVEEAARIMVEKKIGCLPVLEDSIVVGIITEIDLLAQLMEMLATRVPGVRVTVRMPDPQRPHEMGCGDQDPERAPRGSRRRSGENRRPGNHGRTRSVGRAQQASPQAQSLKLKTRIPT
jgi:acetoin utilization protein AcuB